MALMIHLLITVLLFVVSAGQITFAYEEGENSEFFHLTLRQQVPASSIDNAWQMEITQETWRPGETAVIVCDMWDSHHCYNAVQRVKDMAPRMNEFLKQARAQGALIIHAPSDCMDAYESHPARQRARAAPQAANLPQDIQQWCTQIPAEEGAEYPIDQSDGGEDDDPETNRRWRKELEARGLNANAPWQRQIDVLEIHPEDAITDSGQEVWNLLEERKIDQVILLGVHTNMCVLGRPFGLRQLVKNGKHVVLVRDLTDSMYNPASWPYVNHHSGTDLIVEYIERFICPTIESTDLLESEPHRFFDDQRPHLAVVISEFEYESWHTLPAFARKELIADFKLSYVINSDPEIHLLPGLEVLERADALLLSVWRRALPEEQLAAIRRFLAADKPLVALRTTSHAFVTRDQQAPEGHALWADFDETILGAKYLGHHSNRPERDDPPTVVAPLAAAEDHPILAGLQREEFTVPSWLYQMRSLADSTEVLLNGRIGRDGPEEPVAWTNARPEDGGRTFYTSLGSPGDFELPQFQLLLRNAVYWATGQPVPGKLVSRQKQ